MNRRAAGPRHRRKPIFLSALAGLSLAALAACSGSSRTTATPTATPLVIPTAPPTVAPSSPAGDLPVAPLVWNNCGDFDCSSIVVPLDYTRPRGTTIKLALIRHNAKHRIGTLVINPGGPGASGVDAVRNGLPSVSAIRDKFDIVGFDPRGIGGSNPVSCGGAALTDELLSLDSAPDNAAQIDAIASTAKAFDAQCAQSSGLELLRHVTTIEGARDLDRIRIGLGEAKLDYLGFSYGTYLGARYLQLFPQHAGRIVLDGVVDPTVTAMGFERQQGIGFDQELNAFFADCASRSGCPFTAGTSGSLPAEYDRLWAALKANPIPAPSAPGGRMLNAGRFEIGVATGLYDRKHGWPALASGLNSAIHGDGSTLLRLFDLYTERKDNGTYSNEIAANLAVNCTDRPYEHSIAELKQQAERVGMLAPRVGPTTVWLDAPCLFWPVPPTGHAEAISVPAGTFPTLIVGNTRDPATPYENAVSVHRQLAGSHLVTFDGDGHTAVGTSDCVDGYVSDYLATGTLPIGDPRC